MQHGSYQLVQKLATGGMAEIYLARHHSTEGFARQIVIKQILPEFADDPEFVRSFLAEAKLAGQLSHPNVVQIYDLGRSGRTYFIAMEYIRGFDISSLLRLCRQKKTFFPLGAALRILCDVCAGLDYAHEAKDLDGKLLGIVHRDITPANVIVSMEGPAKIVDFGIAKATARGDGKTKTGTIKGKFAYLAPEQINGGVTDKRADIFAAGIMLYELLTNANPFRGDSDYRSLINITNGHYKPLGERREGVPAELGLIIDKALQLDPDKRYQSCRELLRAVEATAATHHLQLSHGEVSAFLKDNEEGLTLIATAAAGKAGKVDPAPLGTDIELEVEDVTEFDLAPVPQEEQKPARPHLGWVALALAGVAAAVGFAFKPPAVTPRSVTLEPETALDISTDPADAQVLMDGVLLTGSTPMRVRDLNVGARYHLEFVKAGFRHSTAEVEVTQPGLRSAQAALAPVPAPVAPPSTPQPEAKSKKTEKRAPAPVTAEPGEPGRLRVTVTPWGTVSIDGRKVGDTPLSPQELPPGEHVVTIENPDLRKRVTRKVAIRSGKDFTLQENFKAE